MTEKKYTKLCPLADFNGDRKVVELENKKYLMIKSGENFFVIESNCKHMGAPLKKGKIINEIIECPWHGCKYDFKTGKSTNSKHELKTINAFLLEGYICI